MNDVAKRANVALSTVSYALNGKRPISAPTRQRIMEAMEELGYRPHALARGLASKRSRIIGLLFPVPERGLGLTELEFVTSAADAARENGHHLLLWPYEIHDPEELRQFTQQGLVDGVILMEVHLQDDRISLLRETGFPFSLIGRCQETAGISFVDIDFRQSAEEAVRHLAELGHREVALLNQSQAAFDAGYGPAVRAQREFQRAAEAAGLGCVCRLARAVPAAGEEAFTAVLRQNPRLTALVTMNERALPGVMQAIADRGWRVPDDFSVVVLGSSPRLAEMMVPPLTTLDVPSAEMGRLGVELLIQQLEGQGAEVPQVLLPCRLSVRGSSGPPPLERDPAGASGRAAATGR